MEQSFVFLELLSSIESEFSDRAVIKGASERSIVAVYVEVAALRVGEAFVEVEAYDFGTFI